MASPLSSASETQLAASLRGDSSAVKTFFATENAALKQHKVPPLYSRARLWARMTNFICDWCVLFSIYPPVFFVALFRVVWLVSFSNRTHVRGTHFALALCRIRSRGRSRNGCQRKKRLLGTKKKAVGWKEQPISIEYAVRAGALSSLLVFLIGPLGFLFFHHRKLDFLLHVVDAINDNAHFVADGVGLL